MERSGKGECSAERQGAETGREELKKLAGGRMQGRVPAVPARPSLRPPAGQRLVRRDVQSQARPAAPHPRILAFKPIPPTGGLTALLEAPPRPRHMM